MKRPEQDLQKAVAAFLRAAIPDRIWYAVPNFTGNRGARLTGILKSIGLRAGVPDLAFVLPDGRAAFIELKAARGSQTPDQKIFEADCKRLAIPYAVCKSLPEVQGTLEAWGCILRAKVAA